MRPARSPLRPALSHEADSRLTLLRPRQPFWPVARYLLTQRLLADPVMRADTELESSRLPRPPPAHSPRSEALSTITNAARAALAVSSAWASRDGWTDTTAGFSARLKSRQAVAEACGSRSTTAAPSAAATARCRANVVFPVPPFWLMTAIVFIRRPSPPVAVYTCRSV